MSANRSPERYEREGPLPQTVMAYVAVTSDDASILDGVPPPEAGPFRSSPRKLRAAEALVRKAGLTVIAKSELGLSVSGSPDQFRKLTGADVERKHLRRHAEAGRVRDVTHLDIVGDGQPRELGVGRLASENDDIEALILEQPRVALDWSPSPLPPAISRYHLRVPDDVALFLGAVDAHRDGHTGKGITVAMVDTGHAAHPFFAAHGYDIETPKAVVPRTDPRFDPVGHGTGESANLFAVAPGVTLRPYRASDEAGRMVGAVAGFMCAKADEPRIITSSWGGDGPLPATLSPPPYGQPGANAPGAPRMQPYTKAFVAEILDAVEKGILVVFSAGNGTFSGEPQVPGVLSAGGVFRDEDGSLLASDYASAYPSAFYPERASIPDLCGLVGQRPRGQYLLLPVPPGCRIDVAEAQAMADDPGDGTGADDGWALFSGTSAAAPQIAGAAALILEAKAKQLEAQAKEQGLDEVDWATAPILEPSEIADALVRTGTDVARGRCHPRFDAYARPGGPDLATGAGLLNVAEAVKCALDPEDYAGA